MGLVKSVHGVSQVIFDKSRKICILILKRYIIVIVMIMHSLSKTPENK